MRILNGIRWMWVCFKDGGAKIGVRIWFTSKPEYEFIVQPNKNGTKTSLVT